MPLYQYKCKTTGQVFEIFQSIKDGRLTEWDSPITGKKEPCERLISLPAVIFKGDGWESKTKNRGYRGKFTKKIRPRGSQVDAPMESGDADTLINAYEQTAGKVGIKPMKFDQDNPSRPKTTDEILDKKRA